MLTVKVRLQTDARQRLLRHLYRGAFPVLISSPTAWVVNFALYQRALRIFKTDALWNITFSGAIAGVTWSILICPFEMIKCYAQRYHVTSPVAFRRIVSNLGYSGMYRGFTACLCRDIPVSAVYFSVLAGCRRYIPDYKDSQFMYPFVTGSICGIVSHLVGMPGDCIKSQIQTNFADLTVAQNKHLTSFTANFSHFTRQHGYTQLYRGFVPVMARSVMTTGSCIVVVEYVNRTLFSDSKIK